MAMVLVITVSDNLNQAFKNSNAFRQKRRNGMHRWR